MTKKTKIINFIKRLFCRHEYSLFVAGYAQNNRNFVIEVYQCNHCGRLKVDWAEKRFVSKEILEGI